MRITGIRKLAAVVALGMLLANGGYFDAAASEMETPSEAAGALHFETLRLPCPEELVTAASGGDLLVGRDRDSGEIIPLSTWYDGTVFVTIPADRDASDLEVVQQKSLTYTDVEQGYEHVAFKYLSARGVIQGTADGNLLAEKEMTRAEAVSILVRALGLPAETEDSFQSSFEDVAENAWYAGAVWEAEKWGIVAHDAKFYPQRLVSREEFHAMAARAFALTGWLKDVREEDAGERLSSFEDAEKISDYAVSAYAQLIANGGSPISDFETVPGGEFLRERNNICRANPQKPATREEAAILLWDLMRNLPVYPSADAMEYGFDQQMPVIDGSTSTYPYTRAVYGRLFTNETQHLSYPQKHSKSHQAYERLIGGEVDMLFASVYPASDIVKLAEKKGVQLELIPIAYDAQVFFTNGDNPIKGLTTEQISNIYVKNAYKNWKELGGSDAELLPYCRNNDSGSHAQMERHFLKGQPIHESIRVENTSYTMSDILTQVSDAGQENPGGYALGYSIYYYYRLANEMLLGKDEEGKDYLKLLAVDGVLPTDETIADGSYPLSNNSYVVLRGDEPADSPARKMAEFMLTPAGQLCVVNAGYGPLYPAE